MAVCDMLNMREGTEGAITINQGETSFWTLNGPMGREGGI